MPGEERRFGEYEILGEVARGGMAVVYRARQARLSREVALKELAVRSDDPDGVQRFLREARIAASLAHPNIVPVHDYFESSGRPYIVMEYLPRGSLRRVMPGLPVDAVVAVLMDVLAGLAYAHARGVVHRDVKPENVLLTQHGHAKLADFGIAKHLGALAEGEFVTVAGAAIGTPAYMAPEQALGQEVGAWTDLYSTGILAYEAFAGRTPFAAQGISPLQLMARHILEPVPALGSVAPALDGALAGWVDGLTAKEPPARPESARAASAELGEIADARLGAGWRRTARSALRDATTGAVPPAGVTTVPPSRPLPEGAEASRPPRRRGRRAGWAVAAVLILAGAVAAVAAVRKPEQRATAPADARPLARIAARIPVGSSGDGVGLVAPTPRAVFVTNYADDTVTVVDPRTDTVVRRAARVGSHPADVAVAGPVWVVNDEDETLSVLDRATARRLGPDVPVGGRPATLRGDEASAWVSLPDDDAVVHIDVARRRVAGAPIPVGDRPSALALGDGILWVANFAGGTVIAIDVGTREAAGAPIATGGSPTDVTLGAGHVWVADARGGSVARIDPASRRVVARVDVGGRPFCVAYAAGRVWATVGDELVAIAPETNRADRRRLPIGGADNCVRAGAGSLWATVRGSSELLRVEAGGA
jgi:YVTN family beta-propeller protein